jgi:hypothetical protein
MIAKLIGSEERKRRTRAKQSGQQLSWVKEGRIDVYLFKQVVKEVVDAHRRNHRCKDKCGYMTRDGAGE